MNRNSRTKLPVLLTLVIFEALFVSAEILVLEKPIIQLGEQISFMINTDLTENLSLEIIAPDKTMYQYLGIPDKEIIFNPKMTGQYRINLYEFDALIEYKDFFVENVSQDLVLYTNKYEYESGELVEIYFETKLSEYTIEITSGLDVYKYLGEPESPLHFIPKSGGLYMVQIVDMNQKIVATSDFFVSDNTSEPKAMIEGGSIEKSLSKINLFNSRDEIIDTNILFFDMQNNLIENATTVNSVVLSAGQYNIEIEPKVAGIKKIRLDNFTFSQRLDFGVEDVPTQNMTYPHAVVNKAYAIDPSRLDFVNGTVTAIAEGYQLLKCKEYDFSSRTCYGSFETLMSLVPGEEYSFTITPEDPLYTEVTYLTQECTCTDEQRTAPGASSQQTASCTDYCDINFTVPQGAIDGHLEMVHYNVTITIYTTGTPISGAHEGRLDHDEVSNNGNEETIGSSMSTVTETITWRNDDLEDTGTLAFDASSCNTWGQGYCTWKPYLSSQFTCQGSKKICRTTIHLNWINYTWDYSLDTTLPNIQLNDPQNNTYTNQQDNVFYYTPSDNLDMNCSLYINNILNQTNSSINNGTMNNFTVAGIKDGTYTWNINCTDAALNSNVSETRTLHVDANPPGIIYVSPTPETGKYQQAAFLIINVSHIGELNPDKISLYINDLENQTRSYSGTYTNFSVDLDDGFYEYYVVLNDSAGSENQTEVRNITIDTIDPVVVLTEPESGNWLSYGTSITFNFTPIDNNLENCSLYGNFTDSGQFEHNQTKNSVFSSVKNSFQPVDIDDGIYVWNVLCYDKSERSSWAYSNYSLLIDTIEPIVALSAPLNNTYWSSSNTIQFNYTVTDNFNNITNCTLEIISNVSVSYYEEYTILTGSIQDFNVSIGNNKYNWTIRCTDPTANTNDPEPGYYNLTVDVGEDTVGPAVILNEPSNYNWTNANNLVLKFTPSDSSDIWNCTLYINGLFNQSKDESEISNNEENNFTINNIKEGNYNWHINCTDNSTNLNSGASETWNVNVDRTEPQVTLLFPADSYNTSLSIINFTWRAIDNMDSTLLCNLTINGNVNQSNINSNNNTPANRSVLLSENKIYYWNITCIDNIYYTNFSYTRHLTFDNTAPSVNLGAPLNNTISNNRTQVFYYTPSENLIGISNCSLILNTVRNATNYTVQNNFENNFTLSIMNDGIYFWTVNCTDRLNNQGTNKSTKKITIDATPPKTNSYSAVPLTQDLGAVVDITVNVTDNINISKVIAEIVWPSGIRQNYTMQFKIQDIYNLSFYETTERGTYNVTIISNDTAQNKNISSTYHFYVRAGVSTNKTYYGRGEKVNITGSGFDPGDNVTISITDPYNSYIEGFPTTILADISGSFSYLWNISNSTSKTTGNHTILAYDTGSPSQSGTTSIIVVIKPKAAEVYDKSRTNVDVLAELNDTDNSRVTIVTSTPEDYINLSWKNFVPPGQVISDLRMRFQHYELYPYNLYITWYNSSSSSYQTVCIINYNYEEIFDECSLHTLVTDSQSANNLNLRITDRGQIGSSIGDWTVNNFVYLDVDFTTLRTDKEDYEQGETVHIYGSSWPSSTNITLNVSRTNNLYDSWTLITDPYGYFESAYNISFNSSLGIYNLTVYLTGYPADTDKADFNVTARPSWIITDTDYYDKGDTINITGNGFFPGGNAAILIYDFYYNLVHQGYANTSDTFNGTFEYLWQVPQLYNGTLGLHSIYAIDTLYDNLNGTANPFVVITPDEAVKTENSISSNILDLVNKSDNITSTLFTYNDVEDFIQLGWINSSIWNYEVIDCSVSFEHNESQLQNLNIQWYNGTNWIDVCTVPYITLQNFSSCNLFAYVNHASDTGNITLRITDKNSNTLANGASWTSLDFSFLDLKSIPDTKNPNITLLTPVPDSEFNLSNTVKIQINASDNVYVSKVYANISSDLSNELIELMPVSVDESGNGIYESNFTGTVAIGLYNITIIANDTMNNINNTIATNFSVYAPDFTTNSSYINFSNPCPSEGEQLGINVTIFNNGNLNISNVTVQFWDGYYGTGQQINGDIQMNISALTNVTVNITWTAEIGTHNIYIAIDPPIQTNGTYFELNETNNVANSTIIIPAWHIFYGNYTGLIVLGNELNKSQIEWNATTTGNVYAVETGSNIDWLELEALSQNTSQEYQFDDFNDADIALGMENFSDSVNATYTDNNYPKAVDTFNVYTNIISNVPIVNSTNSSYFTTGILWDTSDLLIGHYNGTQDLVFVTKINRKQEGKYGTYDYEFGVPALLKTYKQSSGSVTLYIELT
ncbi:hypothetical protein JW930_07780 [Candidatus Woesearchaeota archaeon]|nr:hypothetical protein [Candidatus Woesearchaeota archaeon]